MASCFVASDLVLHCLPMSHKKDAMRIRVKIGMTELLYQDPRL